MSRGGATYLPTLDGWRAIAISLVLFCHVSVGIGLGQFRDVGLLGVQIFFGLSGFLITTLLLSEESRLGSISLRGFYTRRAFRILPAALVFLMFVGALSVSGIIHVSIARWLGAVFFMANYSRAEPSWYVAHFWSLAVEEHFYLIWPATMLLVRGRKRLAVAVSLALIVALWRAIDFKYRITWTDSAWFWGRTDINADGILFGVVYALALQDAAIGAGLKRLVTHALAAPAAIVIFTLSFVLPYYLDWKLSFMLLTVRAAVAPAMILATMYAPYRRLGRVLEMRSLRYIGLISYSLYLWQQMFLAWEPNPHLALVQWFPVNLALAVGCATASLYLIERPMIGFGRALMASRVQRSEIRLPVRRPKKERLAREAR